MMFITKSVSRASRSDKTSCSASSLVNRSSRSLVILNRFLWLCQMGMKVSKGAVTPFDTAKITAPMYKITLFSQCLGEIL